MSRPLYVISEKEEVVDLDVVKGQVEYIVAQLSTYLETYRPGRPSFTKSSLIGPVGKMLSVMTSGRMIDEQAILGYVTSIHNNTSTEQITEQGLSALSSALKKFEELRRSVSKRTWLRILREIDYAVYVRKYRHQLRASGEQKKQEGGERA